MSSCPFNRLLGQTKGTPTRPGWKAANQRKTRSTGVTTLDRDRPSLYLPLPTRLTKEPTTRPDASQSGSEVRFSILVESSMNILAVATTPRKRLEFYLSQVRAGLSDCSSFAGMSCSAATQKESA